MPSVYRIGDLRLDAGRQELSRGAERIHLGPLTYKLLLALVDAAPDMVSHDALAHAVWDGRAVSQETIGQRIKLLRAALGDDAHHPRYIEIVRGRGYRMIASVAIVSAGRPWWRRRILAGGTAVLLSVIAATLVWLRADPVAVPSPSVAVLPFADLSPAGDQAYFADGLAEEILTLLSKRTPLRVIARTSSFSFKEKTTDIETIARQLNVSHVLEGSVRKSEGHIRVAVQLIAAANGAHVWSESYDMEVGDVLELQNRIAGSVAAALETRLLEKTPLPEPVHVHPEAFEAYLRGQEALRYFSYPSLAAAEYYFRQSIEIDPAFLPAYVGLGRLYERRIVDVQVPISETVAKLRAAVRQGFDRAPDDPGLIGLGALLARFDGDNGLAERRFRRSLELDPSNVAVAMLYATFRLDQGHPLQALREFRRLLELDPLNPELQIQIWACHMDLWDAGQALRAIDDYESVTAEPRVPAFSLRGSTRMQLLGDLAGGIRDFARATDLATRGATRSTAMPELYYGLGDLTLGDAALAIHQKVLGADSPFLNIALVYRDLAAGEIESARERALRYFTAREDYSASFEDRIMARLAVDALLANNEADRAVALIERMAPVYTSYRSRPRIEPEEFSPAPYAVKGTQSSYPALYFPDYIRALRAAGDASGAENMLRHLEAIHELRRERGLFLEARHVAEARALRGELEGALDALEQAERERTIYATWHVFLLHNEIFAGVRDHPRFRALLGRVADEVRRQRSDLASSP